MEYLKSSKKQLLVVGVLLLGLMLGVYLVQIKHIFKSRASGNFSSFLDIDNQAQPMVKDESKNGGLPTYTVQGDKIRIKLKDQTVEKINDSL